MQHFPAILSLHRVAPAAYVNGNSVAAKAPIVRRFFFWSAASLCFRAKPYYANRRLL